MRKMSLWTIYRPCLYVEGIDLDQNQYRKAQNNLNNFSICEVIPALGLANLLCIVLISLGVTKACRPIHFGVCN